MGVRATGVITLTRTDGSITYAYIRYSPNSDGSNMTESPNTATRYMGIYYSTTSTASTNPADYTWSLIKGGEGTSAKDIIEVAPLYYIKFKYAIVENLTEGDYNANHSYYYYKSTDTGRYTQCTEKDVYNSENIYYRLNKNYTRVESLTRQEFDKEPSKYYTAKGSSFKQCGAGEYEKETPYYTAEFIKPSAPTTEIKIQDQDPEHIGYWTKGVPIFADGYQYWTCVQTIFEHATSVPNTDDAINSIYINSDSETIVNIDDKEGVINSTSFDENGNLIIDLDTTKDYEIPIKDINLLEDGTLKLILEESVIAKAEEILWSDVVLHDALNTANEKALEAKDKSDEATTTAKQAVKSIEYWYCASTQGASTPLWNGGWKDKINETQFGTVTETEKYDFLWVLPIYKYGNGTYSLSNSINKPIPSDLSENDNDYIREYSKLSNTMEGIWSFLSSDQPGATTINGGHITTGSITAGQDGQLSTIGNFTIGTEKDANGLYNRGFLYTGQKKNMETEEAGIYIGTDGILLNGKQNPSKKFKVDVEGNLTATNANISGTITALQGQIGSSTDFFKIGAGSIYNQCISLNDTEHSGIYLGTDGIKSQTLLGNSFNIDTISGTDLTFNNEYYYTTITNDNGYSIYKINLNITTPCILSIPYEFSTTRLDWEYSGVVFGLLNGSIEDLGDDYYAPEGSWNSWLYKNSNGTITYNLSTSGVHWFYIKIYKNNYRYTPSIIFRLKLGVEAYSTTISGGKITTNNIEATGGTFTGTVNATDGYFNGTVNATKGIFSNCTIGGDCIINGNIQANQIEGGILNCSNFDISNLTADYIKGGTLDLTEGITIGGENCATTINQNSIVFDNGSSYTGIGISGLQASIRKWSGVTISDGGSSRISDPNIVAFQSFGPIVFIRIYATFNKNTYTSSTWYHVATINNAPLPNTTYYSCTKSGTRIMRYYINSSGKIYASPSGSGYTAKKSVTKYVNFWYFSNDIASKYPISFSDKEEGDDEEIE